VSVGRILAVASIALALAWITRSEWRPLPPPPLPSPPAPGETRPPAPGFSPADPGGSPASLGTLSGQVVLLHFWATWCRPCRRELPTLAGLHETLAGEDVTVLGVNVDRNPDADVTGFAERHAPGLPVLRDVDGEIARRYRVKVYPTTYVVDRRGRLVRAIPGAWDWITPETVSWLRALAAE
jgi:thiol-disulfide isomerase/thioredoxin